MTADEIPDPQDIDLWLEIDGIRIQQASTSDMLWPVAELIAHISDYMALEPGDVIQTGTPAGIGVAQSHPRYLHEGNQVSLGGAGLGEQRCRVVRVSSPGTGERCARSRRTHSQKIETIRIGKTR